jgi:hypothetical protein
MALDLTVPGWLERKLQTWVDRLQMHEWEVRLRLDLTIDNNEDCRGQAEHYPGINLGRIVLRADVEDSEEWEITLVHELLHIKHSRIDAVVDHAFIASLAGSQSAVTTAMAETVYRQAYEPFIDSMAKVLVKLSNDHQPG